jgi:hypothetical protein
MFERSSLSRFVLGIAITQLVGCTVELQPANDGDAGAPTSAQAGGATAVSSTPISGGASPVTSQSPSAGSAGVGSASGLAGAPSAAGAAGVTSNAGAAGINVAIPGGANSGGASGLAGNGVAGNGVAGNGAVPCGNVTALGVCSDDVLTYCEDTQLKSVDCAVVGAKCQIGSAGPECQPTARALSCGSLTKLGTCDGAKIRYCDETGVVGVPREIDCAAYGQICNPTASPKDGGALCVPQGACPTDVPEAGVCSGNHLRFCQNSQLYDFDCGLDQCKKVSGFADCFMADVTTGCGTETAAGRCDGNTRVSCSGNTTVTEDCAAVGLECRAGAAGMACLPPTKCSMTCPTGYSCSGGHCSPTNTPTRDWTIAVYMVGNNNLSDAAWGDLNEMESVGSSNALAIAVQAEFSSLYSNEVPYQYRGPTYRMLVASDSDPDNVSSLETAQTLGDTNMSDGTSLTNFVRWAASTYPAKHFALVLWDHGMGYDGGFVDESAGGNDYLTLKELAGAVANSGVHPDLVAFDACLMGIHELALSMRGVANWMAASEELEPGNGYPYDRILQHLQTTPNLTPQQLGTAIVDEYSAFYASSTRLRSATQSLIDLSKVGAFNDQLASFSETVSANLGLSRLEMLNALDSPSVIRFKIEDSADISSAMTAVNAKVGGDIGAAAATLGSYFDSSGLVAHNAASGKAAAAKGLAFFFPQATFSATTLYQYRWETNFLPLQSWQTALTNLRNNTSSSPAPGTGAIDAFSVVLSWANTPDGKKSGSDLDLYVYEPNGDFAVAVNGTVSENGVLSGDSYDTGVNSESYRLKSDHEAGTYIVLVHFYDGPKGETAYPRLQLFRNDLPGGSRTYVRGKITNKKLVEAPMSNTKPLTTMIDETNFAAVQNLEYSNIWYAITLEVK